MGKPKIGLVIACTGTSRNKSTGKKKTSPLAETEDLKPLRYTF